MYKRRFVFIPTIMAAVLLILSGCTDEARISRLREDISNKEKKIQSIEYEATSLASGLDLAKSAILAIEAEKEGVKVDLNSLKSDHPVIYGCIVSNGGWAGLAAMFSGDEDLVGAGMVVGYTCLMAAIHEDYDYVKGRISDLNSKSERISVGLAAAKIELDDKQRQVDLKLSEYRSAIQSLKIEIDQANSEITCEENIACKIKNIINKLG